MTHCAAGSHRVVRAQDPWAADIIDGKIYARGTQDMKGVAMQIWEALVRLKAGGYAPERTIHMLLVPDEEVGGNRGIKLLLASPLIKTLRPACVLDEGLPSPDGEPPTPAGGAATLSAAPAASLRSHSAPPAEKFCVYYGERKIWWLRVKATGPAGHGSRFIPRTATQKLHVVIDHVFKFRDEQEAALQRSCGCGKQLGDFTTMVRCPAGAPHRTHCPLTAPSPLLHCAVAPAELHHAACGRARPLPVQRHPHGGVRGL